MIESEERKGWRIRMSKQIATHAETPPNPRKSAAGCRGRLRRNRRRVLVMLAMLGVAGAASGLLTPTGASAVTRNWLNDDSTWSTGGNWSGGAAPTSADEALFNSNTVDVGGFHNVQLTANPTSVGTLHVSSGNTVGVELFDAGTPLVFRVYTAITLDAGAGWMKFDLTGAGSRVDWYGNVLVTNNSTTTFDGTNSLIFNASMASEPNVSHTITFDGAGNTKITGAVTNQGTGVLSLIKSGTGTLSLTNAAGNTYTGTTTINAGKVALTLTGGYVSPTTVNANGTLLLNPTASSSFAAPITLSGGTLSKSGATNTGYQVLSGSLIVTAASIINVADAGTASNRDLFADGGILGTGNLTINTTTANDGVNFRSATAGTYTGSITVNGPGGIGARRDGADSTQLQSADITLNGATFALENGPGFAWANGTTTNNNTLIGALTGDSTSVVTAAASAAAIRGFSVGNNSHSGDFSGTLVNGTNGTLYFIKNGTGTQTLSGSASNSFTGTTAVNAGELDLNKSGSAVAISTGLGMTIGTGTNAAATVKYTGASTDMMGTNAITINGRGQLDFNGSTDTIGNVAIVTTGATTTGTTPIANTVGGGTLTIGTLTITPVAGFTSTLDTATGTLKLPATGTVTFTAATTGQAAINGNLDLNTGQTFNVGLGTGAGFDLNIGAAVSNGSLTKSGTGRLQLSGINSYTGATTISGGNLKVTGSLAAGSAVAINSGGTLSGSGTVNGTVAVNSGGILAPGNSPGQINTGATAYAAGGTYKWEINDVAGTQGADPGWDFQNITGLLNITATSGTFPTNLFKIDITGLNTSNVAGAVSGWDPHLNYTWTLATASGGITNFAANKFALDTTNFANNNGVGSGIFSIATSLSGKDLQLTFTGGVVTQYWDPTNGVTAGTGSATPSGTWSTGTSSWNYSSTGVLAMHAWYNGDDVVFSAGTDAIGAYNVTISSTVTAHNITVEEGSPTVSGGTLTLAGATPTITIASPQTLTISSVLDGATVTKAGTGTLTLSGTNTFTGTLAIQSGTLAIGSINNANTDGTLGHSAAAVTLGSGGNSATLQYTAVGANDTSDKPFTLAGVTDTFQIDSGTTTLTLTGLVSGAANLTKSGPGTLKLNHTGDTAGTVKSEGGGTLEFAGGTFTTSSNINAGSASAGNITISGGTVTTSITGSGGVTAFAIGNGNSTFTMSGGTLNVSGVESMVHVGLTSGTGTWNQTGGDVTLSGTATGAGVPLQIGRAATGIVNISGGTLTVTGGTTALGYSGNGTLNISGSAVVTVATLSFSTQGATTSTLTLGGGAGTFTGGASILDGGTSGTLAVNTINEVTAGGSSTIRFNGGTLKARAANVSIAVDSVVVDAAGGIIDNNAFSITIAQPLIHNSGLGATPDGGLVFKGAGTTALNGVNTYNGGTVVNSGTLTINGSLSSSSAITVNSTATVILSPVTYANAITLNGGTIGLQDNLGSGGNVTQVGNDVIHTFLASGSLLMPGGAVANGGVLVGGGGGGGSGNGTTRGGGGGGGDVNLLTGLSIFAGINTVTVGVGGGGGSGNGGGGSGGTSSLGGVLSAAGGGFGTGGGANYVGGASGSGNAGGARSGNFGGGGGGDAGPGVSTTPGGGTTVGSFGTFGAGGLGSSAGVGGANTGNGGGGSSTAGGAGGSGIVIVRYAYNSTVTLSGAITVQSTSTLDSTLDNGVLIVSGAMTGPGGIRIDASALGGFVRYDTVAKAYQGDTTVLSNALLQLNLNNALPFGSGKGNLVLNGFASETSPVVDLNGFNTAINGLNGTANSVLGVILNDSTGTSATLTLGNNNASGDFAGLIVDHSAGTGTISLIKVGTGTQIFRGANTYTGLTDVQAGELDLANPTNSSIAGDLLISGGTVKLLQPNQISNTRTVTVSGGSTFNLQGFSEHVGGVSLVSGSIIGTGGTLSSTTTFDVQSGSISANLGGTAGLTKSGGGTVILSGANIYSGVTTISGGTLRLTGGNNRLYNNGLDANSDVLVNGTFDLNGLSQLIDELNGSGSVMLGAGTLIVGGATGSGSFTGVISGAGGNLVKAGFGTQTLGGYNTYSGDTLISSGTLHVTATGDLNDASAIKLETFASYERSATNLNDATAYAAADLRSQHNSDLMTTAQILNGTATTQDITMMWRPRESSDEMALLSSDILNLSGVDVSGSNVFVLQMSYDDSILGDGVLLGWLNSLDGLWHNAVDGNTGAGANAGHYNTDWEAFFATHSDLHADLGAFGIDAANNVVWAVVNHNSEFAVIPEPHSLPGGLMLLSIVGVISRRRRRA